MQPCLVARRNRIVLDRQAATLRRYPTRPAPTPIPGPPGNRESSDEGVALYILVVVTWVVTLLTAYLVGAI